MIKVKEYLDEHFYTKEKYTPILKSNGHYNVQGEWFYPKDCIYNDTIKPNIDYICLHINNETIVFGIIYIGGKYHYGYSYLQTYEHLSRNTPDKNGYFARSTDDEIIRYINYYFFKIKNKERYSKIKKIQNKYK